MNRRPWRQHSKNNIDEAKNPEKLGDVMLVDQIKSLITRLIAQMTGFQTNKRYQFSTVYVNQESS